MNTGVMVVGMGMKAAELHRKSSANDDNDEPYIICPRCNGKGVRGKKNKICKTSNGTGKIPLSRFEGLFGIVKQELATYMEDSMRDLMSKYTVVRPEQASEREANKVAEVEAPARLEACYAMQN